jgi:hypothetical protein
MAQRVLWTIIGSCTDSQTILVVYDYIFVALPSPFHARVSLIFAFLAAVLS